MKIQSQDWRKIAEFYRWLDDSPGWDIMPMADLVEEIAASSYAHGVFAATSMHTLCLAQHREFDFDREMLRVDFVAGRFTFTYRESPGAGEGWKKECGRAEGFSTFEHVVRRLRWFVR